MSITLGIYDIFANIIPGFLYLFVSSEVMRVLGFASLDFTNIDSVTKLIIFAFLAYLAGHIMDHISYRLWVRLFYQRSEETAYRQFQSKYSDLKAEFKPEQAFMLFDIIRYNRYEISNDIERNKVICLMLRNVSFALFLLFGLQLVLTFLNGISWHHLLGGVVALIASIVSIRRAELFNQVYYRLVFEYSAIQGNTLPEILKNQKRVQNKRE